MSFLRTIPARRACEAQLRERFEIVQAETCPGTQGPADHRRAADLAVFPRAAAVGRGAAADRREGICRAHGDASEHGAAGRVCLFKRQEYGDVQGRGIPGGCGPVLPARRAMRAIAGRHTGVIRQTRPAGGAARTRLRCSTIRSYTTGRSRPMTRTGAIWRCSAIAVRCRPIRRSSPISPTICCGGRG